MAEIINIDDHRPHIVIETLDRNAHVYPLKTLEDVVNGEQPPSVLDDEVLKLMVLIFVETFLDNEG